MRGFDSARGRCSHRPFHADFITSGLWRAEGVNHSRQGRRAGVGLTQGGRFDLGS